MQNAINNQLNYVRHLALSFNLINAKYFNQDDLGRVSKKKKKKGGNFPPFRGGGGFESHFPQKKKKKIWSQNA